MHPVRLVLALTLALSVAPASAAERGQCEYRHPGHPEWNFLAPCSVSETGTSYRVTTEARVDNGSAFTVVGEGAGEIRSYTVNGHSASRLDRGASRCYLTDAAAETICIHPGGAEAALPDLAADTPAPGPGPEITGIDPATIGGGEKGHCLLWVGGESGDGLIEHGTCVRRENCAVDEASGTLGCLVDFAWASGRTTAMTRVGDEITLDGAVARPAAPGCYDDPGAGIGFCYSQAAMTAAAYPAIAAPPAPEPAPQPAAVPAAIAAAPVPTAGSCVYLRGETEVSRWACTESVTCEAPLCTVDYALDNGTGVTLDVAEGRVMLMNGAKADPVPWIAGAGVSVTRPDAPYTFRFAPDGPAAEAPAQE